MGMDTASNHKSATSTVHFNVSRLRGYTWNRLKLVAGVLAAERTESASREAADLLDDLDVLEQYWAFPGVMAVRRLRERLDASEVVSFSNAVRSFVRDLSSEAFRSDPEISFSALKDEEVRTESDQRGQANQKYFEVLFVDNMSSQEEYRLKTTLAEIRDPLEEFAYDLVVARSFQDALIALALNSNIQACVIRYGPPFATENAEGLLKEFIGPVLDSSSSSLSENDRGPALGRLLAQFRPEVDRYYVTDTPVSNLKDSTIANFQRIFYRKEDFQELHLTIIRGIKERYATPFFSALKEYSKKPTGVFHAMPISRGNSVFKSRWIRDFGDFYGRNMFLAETSATTGGLDSLLQPTGTLKQAQEHAARAFGSQKTFFVTNGTSTSNKIVVQALVAPGDLVLIDRDCHKSHHYGLVLSGAYPVYLDSYPLPQYSMYGAVPIAHIKEKLAELAAAGRLDRVKMLLLTNCTFDGLVYNVERVMEEVLAIKPDIVFLWDEAWFAFAGFSHVYRQRTAMYVAEKLSEKYRSAEYREAYDRAREEAGGGSDPIPGMPDPDKVRIRVYATQSTHKTLSSFRQGSMIHIWDEDFQRRSEASFHEAYMTHISTSPNYQILGSLDVGRRQVEFEGFELVEKSVELAMLLRAKITDHPKLGKYFDVLTAGDLIPAEHRNSGLGEYYNVDTGWNRMDEAWAHDDIVLDPTKINLFVGRTGVDGDTFKNRFLMDKFGIQINKTSRNTVLFMTNIGTTRGSLAYLIRVLLQIADELEAGFESMNSEERSVQVASVRSLTHDVPPLPDFSRFHASFQAIPGLPGGNLREAYFLAYDDERCEYATFEACSGLMASGREIISASFVIPYPPGFPVLVPGQVLSPEILAFLIALDVKEIHGYEHELGLRIFTDAALGRQRTGTAMAGAMINAGPSQSGTKR
ncbi:MAG: arginine decarboxylase [Rhodothermales bacterium]|jgi:arginine decarboxylase